MDYLDYLLKELTERMSLLGEATSRGQCASFEEYKFTCGQLRGLEAACAIIKDLKDRLENSDDE